MADDALLERYRQITGNEFPIDTSQAAPAYRLESIKTGRPVRDVAQDALTAARQGNAGPETTQEFIGREVLPLAKGKIEERYRESMGRFQKAQANDEDLGVIARYEAVHKTEREEGLGRGVLRGVANVPKIVLEATAGGRAVGLAKAGLGLGRAAAGAAGAAEAAPLLSRAGAAAAVRAAPGQLATGAATTPALVDMYYTDAQQRATRNGGEWYDAKNIAPAAGYAVLQAAVLGHAQRVAAGAASTLAGRAAAGGTVGVLEQSAGDTAATLVDNFLIRNDAYKVGAKYGAVAKAIRGEEGSAKELATQLVTFSLMSALHGAKPGEKPDLKSEALPKLVEAADAAKAEAKKAGLSEKAAEERLAFVARQAGEGRLPESLPKWMGPFEQAIRGVADRLVSSQMRGYQQDAARIAASLEPPAPGYSRLWRGNRPGEEGKNPSFSDSLTGIALPFRKGYGGKLTYVDVPTDQLPKYRTGPEGEYIVPAKYAKRAVTPGESADPYAGWSDADLVSVAQQISGFKGKGRAKAAESLQKANIGPEILNQFRSQDLQRRTAPQNVEPPAETSPEAPGRAISPEAPESRPAGEVAAEAKPGPIAGQEPPAFGGRLERDAALSEAKAAVKKGQSAVYVDMDIDNMAGLVNVKGADEAVAFSREAVGIIRAELAKVGAKVEVARHAGDPKGDEYSAVVIGANKAKVDAALDAASAQIAELARSKGVADIPHAKEGRRAGVGVTTFAEPIRPGVDPVAEAEAGVESRKASPGRPRQPFVEIAPAKPPGPAAERTPAQEAELKRLIAEQKKDAGSDRVEPERVRPASELPPDIEAAIDAADLTTSQREALKGLMRHESTRAVGKRLGVSHEEARKLANQAILKLAPQDPDLWRGTAAEVRKRYEDAEAGRMAESLRGESLGYRRGAPGSGEKALERKFGRPLTAAEKRQGVIGGGAPEVGEAARVTKPPQTETALANARTDAERVKNGLPEILGPARLENAAVWDAAMARVDEDPNLPFRLVDELAAEMRATTVEENAILLRHKVALSNEYGRAIRQVNEAVRRNVGKNDPAAANEIDRLADRADEILALVDKSDKVNKATGTEWGRAGQFRRQLAAEDFSLAGMLLRAEAAAKRPLTPEEKAKVTQIQEKLAAADTRLAEAEDAARPSETRPVDRPAFENYQAALKGKGDQPVGTVGGLIEGNDTPAAKELVARAGKTPVFVADGLPADVPARLIHDSRTGRSFIQLNRSRPLTATELAWVLGHEGAHAARGSKGRPLGATPQGERAVHELSADKLAEAVSGRKRGLAAPEGRPGDMADLRIATKKVRTEFGETLAALRHSSKPLPVRAASRVLEAANVFRTLMTAYDFSGLLRQAGFVAFARPVRTAKGVPDMFRAFASERAFDRQQDAIRQRPNTFWYDAAGLELTEVDGPLSKAEEGFGSRLAAKIPGVKASARAYSAILNRVRADSFDAMLAGLSKDGKPTIQEAKAVANFVNVATGRGKLGQLEPAAGALANVFFSPRYVASRFQVLAGQPLYNGSWRTRKLIAQEYARMLGGLAAFYTLASLLNEDEKITFDPRSSDFGKVRFGNTRLDPLFGLAQITTLGGRVATGETVDQRGNVKDLRRDVFGVTRKHPKSMDNTADVIWRFVRSKGAPVPAAAIDLATGENVVGEKVRPVPTRAELSALAERGELPKKSVATNLITPLGLGQTYEVMLDQGMPRSLALAMLNLLGMGVQVYQKK